MHSISTVIASPVSDHETKTFTKRKNKILALIGNVVVGPEVIWQEMFVPKD